ncbi:unnamed protein product [Zymoseptoria tritici ST99CH_3D1]|nr:unnamed protein product [Zymoseptoria tritici ST99CH_3D1]
MLPFAALFTSRPRQSDNVTLCEESPSFDKALHKDTFLVRGVKYTRCAVVVSPHSAKGRKGKSPVWKAGEALLCSKDSKKYYYCYHCETSGRDQELPMCNNGNTGALNHLFSRHQLDRQTGAPVIAKEPGVKTSFTNGVVYQQLTIKHSLLDFKRLIVRWMVYCHIAFRMVENEYFRDLVNFLSSSMGGFLPRAASTIRGWIMEAYAEEKVKVQRELRDAVSSVHLSFDGWTSPNNYSILSVFAHFVDKDGIRRQRLLAFRRTYGAKSALNEAAALMEVIKEYSLERKLGYFMCDNIGTNDALVDLILKELYPHWTAKQRLARRLRCLGHIANLCARALLLGAGAGKALAALEAKVRKGALDAVELFWSQKGAVGMLHNTVRFMRGSPQRIERFAEVVVGGVLEQFDELKLIQDNDTRWNSTFYMIARALDLKERIDKFVKGWLKEHKQETELKNNRLKAQHWKQLDRIHDTLKIFESATINSQGNRRDLCDYYPTISFILDTLNNCKTEFANDAVEDPSYTYISQCCDHAWHKTEKYYLLCDNAPILYAAVYLNPLAKKQWFKGQWTQPEQAGWLDAVDEQVTELWHEYKAAATTTTTAPSSTAPRPADESMDARLRDFKRVKMTHRTDAMLDELAEYLSTDPLPDPQYISGEYNKAIPKFDALNWW